MDLERHLNLVFEGLQDSISANVATDEIRAALKRAERVEALVAEVLELYDDAENGTYQAQKFVAGMADLRAALVAAPGEEE